MILNRKRKYQHYQFVICIGTGIWYYRASKEKEYNMMNISQIQQKLSKGSTFVTFTKKSGEVVVRELTLDPTLVPVFEPKTDRVTRQSLDTVRVYDLTTDKFISLIPANVEVF